VSENMIERLTREAQEERPDLSRVYPRYGDCCDHQKQYAPWPAFRDAAAEVNRLKLVVQHLEQALEQERTK